MPWLNIEQAARAAKITARDLEGMLARRDIPVEWKYVGGTMLIARASLEAWIAGRAEEPARRS